MNPISDKKRIESKIEVQTYLDRLKYAIESGSANLLFQKNRKVDRQRDSKYTNRYTISKLFPSEDETEVLKRELLNLKLDEYIETVEDIRFPNKSEMRVFGKKYLEQDVFIKIRVELFNSIHIYGDNHIFVMSFHFSDREFKEEDFPYKKN